MKIGRIAHKGPASAVPKRQQAIPAGTADELRKMSAFFESMSDPEELKALPIRGVHELMGARKGTWSLHVTRNWRLTFVVDPAEREIRDLDLEDCH